MATISGSLSSKVCTLSGNISVAKQAETYSGDYEITPQAHSSQTLATANKLLTKDITVSEVPYSEVTNRADGLTVYIASEV